MTKIVKSLDDIGFPELLDHVGIQLWRAAALWKNEFDAGMIEAGHAIFGHACSGLLAYMDRDGTHQSDLVQRSGLTKQAVQQFVDELVAEGIVERISDPQDRRGRIVLFTQRGRDVLADANEVKRRVEDGFRRRLGAGRFRELVGALKDLG